MCIYFKLLVIKVPVDLDGDRYNLLNEQKGIKNFLFKDNYENGKDKFKGISKNIKDTIQLTYGEKIGLGQLDYELIKI